MVFNLIISQNGLPAAALRDLAEFMFA